MSRTSRSMVMHSLSLTLLFTISLLSQGSTSVFANELPTATPKQVGMSAQKLVKVNEVMNDLVKRKRVSGVVVLVVRDGKVCFFEAAGKRDLESDKPMQKDTIFRIYSMTKAITTAAAMQLYDRGKLKPSDPVSRFIPEMKGAKVHVDGKLVDAKREVTVADLMRHTSGYTYGSGPGVVGTAYRANPPMRAKDLEEMGKRLKGIPLVYQPGEAWQYSMSIDILGLVVERASGQKLDVYLKENFFDPLNMKDTSFSVPKQKVDRFAASYSPDGKGGLKLIDAPKTSRYAKRVTFFSGGGGLCSTARDYAHFLAMIQNEGELFGQRILKKATVKMMTKNQLSKQSFPIGFGRQVRDGIGFGFGFAVTVNASKFDKHRPIGEFGWGGAASTHFWASPTHNLFVVTLEQRKPYTFETENLVKPLVYDAVQN